ncbi:uncharacterized protein BO97DRAFT_419625 [Aspergillus homomorphus CBS 101889]|uniref:Uncharacterized protein n=1 Tax=Aspergillus homomorphus (strain CBS 101889) TaxID=1450537 RepID=A0A395IBF8_ASPHC|nr:hypothetical protein BO97DRAFT_419625 [Aspergillus homomorphus CBS 101889]RAL17386.1 hypothetical protein BO97DRAFT_419625 [Aspergillus homomorphus CBS 101889]
MKHSLLLSVAYGLLFSPLATSAPTAKPVKLRVRSDDLEALRAKRADEATALYAYIAADSELNKRDEEATALYAYIAADSELDKRDEEATALYAYIAADSELEKRDEEATALYAYIAADSELENN